MKASILLAISVGLAGAKAIRQLPAAIDQSTYPNLRIEVPQTTAHIRALYSDGDHLVSVGDDRALHVWSVSDGGGHIVPYPLPTSDIQAGHVNASAFYKGKTAADDELAIGTSFSEHDGDGYVYVLRPFTGEILFRKELPGYVTAIAFSERGDSLELACFNPNADKTPVSCSFETKAWKQKGGPAPISDRSWKVEGFASPEGNKAACVLSDDRSHSSLAVMDLSSGKIDLVEAVGGTLICIAQVKGGYLYGGKNGVAGFWKPGKKPTPLKTGTESDIQTICPLAIQQKVVLGLVSKEGDLGAREFDFSQGDLRELQRTPADVLSVSAIVALNDGDLAIASLPNDLTLVDANSLQAKTSISTPMALGHVGWSSDSVLCTGPFEHLGEESAKNFNLAFDLAKLAPTPVQGELLTTGPTSLPGVTPPDFSDPKYGTIYCHAFLPNQQCAAYSNAAYRLFICGGPPNKAEVTRLNTDSDIVDLAVSPDKRFLAGAGLNGIVYVWRISDIPTEVGSDTKAAIDPEFCLLQTPTIWILWSPKTGYYDSSTGADNYFGYQMVDSGGNAVFEPASGLPGYKQPGIFKHILDAPSFQEAVSEGAPGANRPPAAEVAAGAPFVEISGVENAERSYSDDRKRYTATGLGTPTLAIRTRNNSGAPTVTVNNTEAKDASLTADGKSYPLNGLAPGENWVTVTVSNDKGTASDTVIVDGAGGDGSNAVGKLYVATIGVDGYGVSGSGYAALSRDKNSHDASKEDADNVYAFYTQQPRDFCTTLWNLDDARQTTRAAIEQKLADLSANSDITPSDYLLLYLSGHGDTGDQANPDGYFVPNDGNHKDRSGTCIPWQTVIRDLKKVNCKVVVLVVDACHAGEAQQTLESLYRESTSGGGHIVLLASSAADESSFAQVSGSLFTTSFLQGLRGKVKDQQPGKPMGGKTFETVYGVYIASSNDVYSKVQSQMPELNTVDGNIPDIPIAVAPSSVGSVGSK